MLAFNCFLTLNSIRNPNPKSSRNPIPHSNRIPNPKSSKSPNPKPSRNPNPNFHCGVRLWFNRPQEIKSYSPKNDFKLSAACRKIDPLLCILQWKSKLWQSWTGSLVIDCRDGQCCVMVFFFPVFCCCGFEIWPQLLVRYIFFSCVVVL